MVEGTQRLVGGSVRVETHLSGMDVQGASHPNIIDTSIEPGPVWMRHYAIGGFCRKCSFGTSLEYYSGRRRGGETMIRFKGAYFPQEMILTCVHW